MYFSYLGFCLLFPLLIASSSDKGRRSRHNKGDETPQLPVDPNTTNYCTWWFDNTGVENCSELLESWSITADDLVRWNPSLKMPCTVLPIQKSYCVEALNEPPRNSPSSTSSAPTSIMTTTGNGISTPEPIFPGMVDNCNKFYMVRGGDGCQAIADKSRISLADLYKWNPNIDKSCSNLWKDANICVSVLGYTSTLPVPTTSSLPIPKNAIQTPTSIQPGIVDNCDAFYYVKKGQGCQTIIDQYRISLNQFISWNKGVGDDCRFMWADSYVCVSIIGI